MLATRPGSVRPPLQAELLDSGLWYALGMSLANSNGPLWIRKQKVLTDRSLEGVGPIRRFLAALFGRTSGARRPARQFSGQDDGKA